MSPLEAAAAYADEHGTKLSERPITTDVKTPTGMRRIYMIDINFRDGSHTIAKKMLGCHGYPGCTTKYVYRVHSGVHKRHLSIEGPWVVTTGCETFSISPHTFEALRDLGL
jgi:hypothetical protein